ncbi:MAG: hypothetical protein P4M15_06995 [Alphaproteobacteria bacterium]|nr:hypothetical protein [Alphaproteobacteria bacterium]
MKYLSQTLRQIAAIFHPPFDGLAFMVILYYAWAQMVFPHNDVVRGNFPDPDDYMYLDQVIDWLKGQNWYDNVQHRLDVPYGTPIHFSRFAQMPMAAGIWLFHKMGLAWRGAATVLAWIYPLFLLGGLLAVMRRAAAHLVPANWAGASAYVVLFMPGLLFEFMPGHVDHHGLVIILLMAAFGCLMRLVEKPEDAKAAISAGLLMAFTMMIALEAMPWLLLASALLGLWAMRHGGAGARNAAFYAIAYLLGTIACLAFTRPPAAWFEQDILTYSIVYVAMAAAIAAPFIGVALAPAPLARWAVGSILALVAAELFLMHFPELASGPYGAIDPQLVPLLLNEAQEALPILKTTDGWSHFTHFMGLCFIAVPAVLYFARTARGVAQEKWIFVSVLLLAGIGLTVFYQYRFIGDALALSALPLTALLAQGWRWIGRTYQGRTRVLAEIGLLLLVGPLPSVLLPALYDDRSFNTGVLLFPIDAGRNACDMVKLEHVLRDPNGLGKGQHTILSEMTLGPEFLFRTDDRVLSAPFHMNVMGNLDANRFFTTLYPEEAERIARRRGVDIVISCNPALGLDVDPNANPPSMVGRLFKGPVPDWLTRVPTPGITNFVVYRVNPETKMIGAKAPHAKKNPVK